MFGWYYNFVLEKWVSKREVDEREAHGGFMPLSSVSRLLYEEDKALTSDAGFVDSGDSRPLKYLTAEQRAESRAFAERMRKIVEKNRPS